MTDRVHDCELEINESVVRALLQAQTPSWADCELSYLRTAGTSNAMWRARTAGDDLVVRIPRRTSDAATLRTEAVLLPALADTALAELVALPELRHLGLPDDAFPESWLVLNWLGGVDAWTDRSALDLDDLAVQMATLVSAIGASTDLPAPRQPPGQRGGPLPVLLDRLDGWLDDPELRATELIDVAGVRRIVSAAREVSEDPVPLRFTHGDLIPGNLLTVDGQLSAVIDWGRAGYGDPAQDLAPAWGLFEGRSRDAFRETLGLDDATWLRACAIELEHAVGCVLYYLPRGHPLGDAMSGTLTQLLAEPYVT